MVTTTMGCVLVTFLVTLVLDRVWAGLLYPLFAAGLMFGVHRLLARFRPLAFDPEHTAVQESVALGGLLSVLIAFQLSRALTWRELLYGGLATGTLGFLSLALENFYVAREQKAAALAKAEAEKGRRTGEDGDLGAAYEALQEALLTSEMAYGSNHPQVATIITYLAEVAAGLGHPEACRLLLERAAQVHEALGESSAQVSALRRYADHLRRHGDNSKALEYANRAVSVSRKVNGDGIATARCLLSLALLEADHGHGQRAYKTCYEAAHMLEKSLGRNHRETILARAAFARRCIALGRAAEGERILTELIAQRERVEERAKRYDVNDLNVLLDLAIARRKSDPQRAGETYARAVKVFRSAVGPGYERAAEMLEPLPDYLASRGTPEQRKLYELMAAGDAYATRQVLREQPDLVGAVDASGWMPLQWACFFGLTDVVSFLLNQGADLEFGQDVDYPALYVAARWGRHRAVGDIVQRGPEVNLDISCVDGSRPLHGAARSGSQLTFDILVSREAPLNVHNYQGWTPLHEAAFLSHRKFVVQLIAEGMDPDSQGGPSFDTPLHAAARGNSYLTTETLLLNGARLELKNADGQTALELAQELAHERVVAMMEAVTPGAGKAGKG